MSLDRLVERHKYFYQINPFEHPNLNARSFLIGYASLLYQLDGARRVVDAVGREASTETLLDEASERHSIPPQAFHALQSGLTNPKVLLRLHAGRAHLHLVQEAGNLGMGADRELADRVRDRYDAVVSRVGEDPEVLMDNPLDTLESLVFEAWFPMQKSIAEGMSVVRTTTRPNFVTLELLGALEPRLQPGDILLERRNWYLTNVGLPGFWPHAALYVGTPKQLDAHFTSDESRGITGGAAPSSYLLEHLPEVAARLAKPDAEGHPLRVVEAIGEGVTLTSLEHSGNADYLAVLRPRLGSTERLEALLRALAFVGSPYDYDFDFVTDRAIVCSELVYKAYRAPDPVRGLSFELIEMAGRPVLPPNEIARAFDAGYDGPGRQLDLVAFLDGSEERGVATEAGVNAFRASWRRSKWDVMQE